MVTKINATAELGGETIADNSNSGVILLWREKGRRQSSRECFLQSNVDAKDPHTKL